MYLTYDEYVNMGGTLDETVFNHFEYDAESFINEYTFNRLLDDTDLPNSVKFCMFEVIKLLEQKEATMSSDEASKIIASQTNDGVSTTYNVLSASVTFDNARKEIYRCVKRYLTATKNQAGQKVLYRGIYPNE